MATEDIGALRRRFAEYGQEHVFRFWERLDVEARRRLADQAQQIDLAALARNREATRELLTPGSRRLEAATIERLPEHGGSERAHRRARARGEALLAEGVVGALVVAGGQGTRLGFDEPKGMFPLGPVSERSLFELQAQKLRGLRRRYGKAVPWYLMTSPATDAPTRAFFALHDHFGLPAEDVVFFCQGTVPAMDFQGRLVLEEPDRIAESPDGHGGSITAMARSGALDDMEARGLHAISYYQVDNPLVRIADPTFLGFHVERSSEMSCKVVHKLDPMEKMGVLACWDGQAGVVEYTELDDEHRHLRDDGGELVYWAGNMAIHVLDVAFVRRVARDADTLLPFHASAKKLPGVDDEGRRVEPGEPNGYKLERFVFDALPAARRTCIVEVRREEEYSPVKNAEGGDSPQTAREALVAEAARWLREAGITLPEGVDRIELDHSLIDGPEDARRSGIDDAASAESILLAHGAHA